ncbi:MAG: hypothetical protein J6A69_10185 [Clostridia bacterium]|nr:hypothetical protein [Clostridia bacterium]
MSIQIERYNENDIIPLLESDNIIDKLKLKNLIMEILLEFATKFQENSKQSLENLQSSIKIPGISKF